MLHRKLLGRDRKFHKNEKKKIDLFSICSKLVFCIAKLNDTHFLSQLLNSEIVPYSILLLPPSFFFEILSG